jgi:hypothetical protein
MARGARQAKTPGDEMNEGEAFNKRPVGPPTFTLEELWWSDLWTLERILKDEKKKTEDRIRALHANQYVRRRDGLDKLASIGRTLDSIARAVNASNKK